MSDLFTSVERLSREEVIEAAETLTLWVTQSASHAEREAELPKPFIEKPDENADEIEQLGRLILLIAAANSESAEETRRAIHAAGRKELFDGGVATIVLATLGVFALTLLTRKGNLSAGHPLRIEEEDGRAVVVVTNQISHEISKSLAQILKSRLTIQTSD